MRDQLKLKRLCKKLVLEKEILRKLTTKELSRARGGQDISADCHCEDTGSSRNEQ
jgi:hypothetical protein